jgi:hypothetical protein
MKQQWKKFERIVAAIHLAEAQGATVTWNEHINGRQFDVVIRFKFQFYDYLVLIECKDVTRPVKAEKVEAFITKSRDAGANKAIMVSAGGFQSGARKVARKHNVELFTLSQIQQMPEDMFTDKVMPILMAWPVGFWKTGTKEIVYLSKDTNKLRYQVHNIKLKGVGEHTLAEILEPFAETLAPVDIPGLPEGAASVPKATKEKQHRAFLLPEGTIAVFPITGEEIPVSHILITYWMDTVRLIKPSPVDVGIYEDIGIKYDYKNELTQESRIFDASDLHLGFDTVLEPGKFYSQPGLKFKFYCESKTEKQVTMCLVESYQHGKLIRAIYTQPLPEASKYYVEITDKTEIERLRRHVREHERN